MHQIRVSLKGISFASFIHDDRLCVAQCLKQYEAVSNQLQTIFPEKAAPLFLSYLHFHKPVTTQRLAHWVKELLKETGIDIEVFKAHSMRGAATLAALDKGAYISDILNTVD